MIVLALSVVLAATGSWVHIPAAGGRPEVLLVPSEAPSAALLVSFGVGTDNEVETPGLSYQTQTAMLLANKSLPMVRWIDEAFRAGATRGLNTARHEASFELNAPAAEFTSLAKLLLTGLLAPKLDEVAFKRLEGHLDPFTGGEFQELLIDSFSDADFHAKRATKALPRDPRELFKFEAVRFHLEDYFTPANATIIVVGSFDLKALRALTLGFRGGTRMARPKATQIAPSVHREIRSRNELHLIDFPLSALGPGDAAHALVLRELLAEAVTDLLRSNAVAYSIGVSLISRPWHSHMLLTLPTQDDSAIDLKPFITSTIDEVSKGKFTPEQLRRAITRVHAILRRYQREPSVALEAIINGAFQPGWLISDLAKALDGIDAQAIAAGSLISSGNSFYLKFTRNAGKPR